MVGAPVALALPAAAQQSAAGCPSVSSTVGEGPFKGFADALPLPPCQDPSRPPATAPPLASRSDELPPPAGAPIKPDTRVASTELGFDKGIGPAPGYVIAYHGKNYLVVDVAVEGGGPFFSGGSRYVIGAEGSSLVIGLAQYKGQPSKPKPAEAASIVN